MATSCWNLSFHMATIWDHNWVVASKVDLSWKKYEGVKKNICLISCRFSILVSTLRAARSPLTPHLWDMSLSKRDRNYFGTAGERKGTGLASDRLDDAFVHVISSWQGCALVSNGSGVDQIPAFSLSQRQLQGAKESGVENEVKGNEMLHVAQR